MNATITTETYHNVLALRSAHLTLKEISQRTGVSINTIYLMLKGVWQPAEKRPPRKAPTRRVFRRPEWERLSWRERGDDPTPEEIAAACAEIRASWSDEEFAIRKAFNPDEPRPWTAPVIGRWLVAA